jgi:hypothetical protein
MNTQHIERTENIQAGLLNNTIPTSFETLYIYPQQINAISCCNCCCFETEYQQIISENQNIYSQEINNISGYCFETENVKTILFSADKLIELPVHNTSNYFQQINNKICCCFETENIRNNWCSFYYVNLIPNEHNEYVTLRINIGCWCWK